MTASRQPWENVLNFVMVAVVFGVLLTVGWVFTLQREFVVARHLILIVLTVAYVGVVVVPAAKWVRAHAR